MSILWADKYRPKDLSKLDYHKQQAQRLKKLAEHPDLPHLLIYGPLGAGKKTRAMCLLRELYGSGAERVRMETMHFTTPSNKKLEIMTVSSNYHVEVNPSDVGIYDRVVVMDLIKNMAQSQGFDVNGQRDFKVVVLTDADELSKDAQHALRRTMEKYVGNCRLLLLANSTSRIIPAILSRCLCVRVSAPKVEEITQILHNTCKKEGLNLPKELATKIANKSERNLRRALLMLESCKVEQYPFDPNQNISEPDYLLFIKDTSRKIVQDQSLQQIKQIRDNLYELITHGIPTEEIFKHIVDELMEVCEEQLKPQLIETAAFYEHRMQQGNKKIFHFEAFVVNFMSVYQKYMENALDFNDCMD